MAPIFGTVSPPVATTSEAQATGPAAVSTRKPAPSRVTARISQGMRHSTRPASHSALSIAMTCVAESSQKSWPSVFSCQAMPCRSTSAMKSRGV